MIVKVEKTGFYDFEEALTWARKWSALGIYYRHNSRNYLVEKVSALAAIEEEIDRNLQGSPAYRWRGMAWLNLARDVPDWTLPAHRTLSVDRAGEVEA